MEGIKQGRRIWWNMDRVRGKDRQKDIWVTRKEKGRERERECEERQIF